MFFTVGLFPAPYSETIGAGVVILLGLVGKRIFLNRRRTLREADRAEQAWQAVVVEWQALRSGPEFAARGQAIERLRQELLALRAEREAKIKAAARLLNEEEQRDQFLGQYDLVHAGLPNIGPARVAVLRSWGIESGGHVVATEARRNPGFRPEPQQTPARLARSARTPLPAGDRVGH